MLLTFGICLPARTWVTRNDGLMNSLWTALNETLPRTRNWRWLSASPHPFFIKPLKTLGAHPAVSLPPPCPHRSPPHLPGVEVTIYYLPAAQSLPPLEYPTGTVVLSKALFGACEVKQMLGDPRGRKPMRYPPTPAKRKTIVIAPAKRKQRRWRC